MSGALYPVSYSGMGFEPATFGFGGRCATGLRHTPR